MRITNRRGRVLLEVTGATYTGFGPGGLQDILYTYIGPGIGGTVDIVGLHETITTLRLDCPSSKIEGLLPEPVER